MPSPTYLKLKAERHAAKGRKDAKRRIDKSAAMPGGVVHAWELAPVMRRLLKTGGTVVVWRHWRPVARVSVEVL